MMKFIEHLKGAEVNMSDGVKVEDTQMLDGGAKDSPVFNESNSTKQYKTANIPKDNLGGMNNLNG